MRLLNKNIMFILLLTSIYCESYRETDCHFIMKLAVVNELNDEINTILTYENLSPNQIAEEEQMIAAKSSFEYQIDWTWQELGSTCYCCGYMDVRVNCYLDDTLIFSDTLDCKRYSGQNKTGTFPIVYDTIRISE